MEPFPRVEGGSLGGHPLPPASGRPRLAAGSDPATQQSSAATSTPYNERATLHPAPVRTNTATTTTTTRGPSTTTPTKTTARPVRPSADRLPSIRLRRLPSGQAVPQLPQVNEPSNTTSRDFGSNAELPGRRRSGSAPQRMQRPASPRTELQRQSTATPHMPAVSEEPGQGQYAQQSSTESAEATGRPRGASNASAGSLRRSVMGSLRRRDTSTPAPDAPTNEYDARIVDMLDVVDPEVSTMTTLTNVQNSLFLPDLGRWLNRRPTYDLSSRPAETTDTQKPATDRKLSTIPSHLTPYATAQEKSTIEGEEEDDEPDTQKPLPPAPHRTHSISSVLSETHYAVLPHGASLEGWSDEDKDLLNDHVRHLLHSRREKFKRSMRGFWKYVQRPIGFFITLYAVLITLFGFAWVLFLIGWVNLGNRRLYIINVVDNVLVALFAIMGDGLAPFRVVDTYHMIYIAHYHHLSWSLRKKNELPKLHDHNDLPEVPLDVPLTDIDIEQAREEAEKHEFSVLKPYQQQKLLHHQSKFSRSHTFYKPHETNTHFAFPLRLLVAVVVLLDCHSLFQIALGTCTWAISYHVRPTSLTTVILCCSIACNISAGVVITIGDRKTRKKEVVERMMRQALTEDAMKKLKKIGAVKGVVEIPHAGEDGEQSTWSKPVEHMGEGEGEEFVMWQRPDGHKDDEEKQILDKAA